MAFPVLSRVSRALAASLTTAVVASVLVVAGAPAATAAAVPVSPPAFASFSDRLPNAVDAAAAVGAGQDAEGWASISGHVALPVSANTATGRTYVVAYPVGGEVSAPLAAAAVGADGAYELRAPVGEVVLAVVSEGRTVFDVWGSTGTDLASAEVSTLGEEGLVHDVTLTSSALISGQVTAAASFDGRNVAVVVYPAGGAGTVAVAANRVTSTGAKTGTYAVGGLPAGNYRVAIVSAVTGLSSEWWNNAPSFAKAQTITLASTTLRTGVDAVLEAKALLDTSTPTITGTTTVGQTLKLTTGAWTPKTTFAYQWYANGTAIAKATAATLKLTTAQAGKKITVKVTGTKSGYQTASATSAATAAVLQVLATATPKISGTTTVGQKLTAAPGTWTKGTTLKYQWYIAGAAVSKATAPTFVLPAAAGGKTVTVRVTGSKSGYATTAKTSAATAVIKKILSAPTPKISGSAKVGSRLTAVVGTWTSGTTLKYQWYAGSKAISGATGSSLAIGAGLVNAKITVRVTGVKSGYVSVTRTSPATAAVAYPTRTTPSSAWNCPSWAPIKGNANSGIYHMPSGQYYNATKPEECFRTEAAAVSAGYRKSKR